MTLKTHPEFFYAVRDETERPPALTLGNERVGHFKALLDVFALRRRSGVS
jgi:hypothetical protein